MKEKKLWNVIHLYDEDGGFGDAISEEELVCTIYATDEEAKAFEEKYDKPYVYDRPYASLSCHGIYLEEVKPIDVSEVNEEELEETLHSPDWRWGEDEESD